MHLDVQPWALVVEGFCGSQVAGGDKGDVPEEHSGRIFHLMDIDCVNADGEGASRQACCFVAKEGGQVGKLGVDVPDVVIMADLEQFVEKTSVLEKGDDCFSGTWEKCCEERMDF